MQVAGALLARRSLLDAAEFLLDNKCGLSVVAYGDAVKALLLEKAHQEVRCLRALLNRSLSLSNRLKYDSTE